MNLGGKTAIITGSSSGIGLGIARAMANAGANVVLNSFTDTDADHALADEISSVSGVQARYIKADMSDGTQCRELIALAGQCDILINNAGIQHVAAVEEFPVEKWNEVLAINLTAAFHTIAAALPLMRGTGWGRIINISSAHGLTASPFKSAYIAAKHGLIGLTKTVALETARNAITVNAICPGYVLTPLVEKQIPDSMKEYAMSRDDVIEKVMLARQPSKEFVTVDEIGGTAVFLASEAAAQITGTTISVDGGWTAI
ncbi:MAG: 3-hydroxybutyrate dehydrogenase [Aestuariivita sp.]|nr:3-hydroxybutyrate dehydrogenase [Aestuariivita sp.]